VIVFLQNAWSPLYAGGVWPRRSWLRALATCRSGQRLKLLIDDYDVCENTTPIVGATASSVVPPDDRHILDVLRARAPNVVVACGKQAESVLIRLWHGPLLIVPHPANRVLTDALYLVGRARLRGRFTDRLAMRQTRAGIDIERIAP
jgi:hypothetical protein